jgi:CRP/FNR family transcriptional regulator, nitrogen fixation regulation protein
MGARMTFHRNAEIYGEAEPADYIYKVMSGLVRTCKVASDGRRQIGRFYLPGDIFGLEAGQAHAFSAEAISDAVVLVVKRKPLMALAERDGEVARQLWASTAAELNRAQGRLLLLIKSAQERLAGFLLEMAERSPGQGGLDLPVVSVAPAIWTFATGGAVADVHPFDIGQGGEGCSRIRSAS